MAKVQLQDKNYNVQVSRKILATGTPILNNEGKQEFKIYECPEHDAFYLKGIGTHTDKDKVQEAVKLARKVASEFGKGLLVEPDIAENNDILNFVRSTDGKPIPLTYNEAEELGKITTLTVNPTKITYREKNKNFVEETRELNVPENVPINIVNDNELSENVLALDYMKLNTKNGDFSKIDITSNIPEEKRLRTIIVKDKKEFKLPEKITDGKNITIAPRYIKYDFFQTVMELPEYEDIEKFLETTPDAKLEAYINSIKGMVDDISRDLDKGEDENYKKLVNEHGYSYLKFLDTLKRIIDKHPEFLSKIYGHYKDMDFHSPIYMKEAPLFEDDEEGYHCSLLDKMEDLKETIIELGLEKTGHENTMF